MTRQIILAERGRYLTGTISVLSGKIEMGESIPIDRQHPAVPIALRDPDVQRFMHWARFPFFRVEQHGALTTVHIADARYSDLAGRGWASVSVTVPTP